MIVLVFILILFIVLVLNTNKATICNKQLTDSEYITHMITHHEVAVSMSKIHLQTTKNPLLLDMLRNLIRVQTYEINLMKGSTTTEDEMSNRNIKMDHSYRSTRGDFAYPNTLQLSDTFCDPSFFNMSHKNLHTMSDAMYIQHMIPHHQVAIDMSKLILKTTNNDFIIDLAYNIIGSQQLEIINLHSISVSTYKFESAIL